MIKRSRQAVGYGNTSLLTTYNTNRTMDPLNYNEEEIGNTILSNLRDFRTLIKYNVKNGMYLHKMNGDIVPMASHPFNLYSWKTKQKHIFESIGNWISGERARLMVFPSLQVRLGQEEDSDTLNDLAYLRYYVELLDLMKLDTSNKVIITIGKYDDQRYGVERFIRNFYRLPTNVKARLVLTNEPDGHDVEEISNVCEVVGIPFMMSYYAEHNSQDLSQFLNKGFFDMKASWRDYDGSPVLHIVEKPVDTEGEFYKLLTFEKMLGLDRRIYKHNLSIIYDSSFKDIAAIKMTNCITQAKGVFHKEKCVEEWQRYRYLVMAHDPDAFVEMQTFMENVKDFESFYKRIEQILSRFKQVPNDIFAAEELLLDMTPHIKEKEKREGMSLLKARDMAGFKKYCHGLAEAYDLSQFISNYYFHLG